MLLIVVAATLSLAACVYEVQPVFGATLGGCGTPIEHARTRDSVYFELPCARGVIPLITVKP